MNFRLPSGDTPYLLRKGLDTLAQDVADIETNASGAASRAGISVIELDTIAALRGIADRYSANQQINLAGYYTPGDGGGGLFYVDAADTSSSDDGGSVIVLASGQRAKAIFGGEINVRRFGVISDWDINSWTGTDSTSRFQAAIDYAESLTACPPVFVPAGSYGLDTVRAGKASIVGVRTSGNTLVEGSRLCHKSGATGDMIKADLASYAYQQSYAEFRDLTLIGSAERNQVNQRPIVSVASRNSFRVAVEHLPTATDVSNFPFYGFCFFYTSEGQYLGSGVVSAINAGTGDVTLWAGWDNYATTVAGAGLLTTAEKVVFSPPVGSGFVDLPSGRADATAAGYAGIACIRTGFKRITRCTFRSFHVGIRRGSALVVDLDQCWTSTCKFAGVASVVAGWGSDDSWARLFTQGQYSADYGKTYTISLADTAYQKSLFGVYAVPARNIIADLSVDECVHCVLDFSGFQVYIGLLLCDKPVKEAILSLGGSAQGEAWSIGTLQLATPQFTLPTALTYYTGSRTAITLFGGATRKLCISVFDLIRFPGAPSGNDYTNLVNAQLSNTVSILAFRTVNGYTNVSTSGNYPLFGDMIDGLSSASTKRFGGYKKSSTELGVAVNGSEVILASASSVGANPSVGLGNNSSATTNREGVDIKKSLMVIGLDQANRALRSDLSTHEGWLLGVPYDLSQANTTGIGVVNTSTQNILFLGGGIGDKQAVTRYDFYAAAAQNTLTGTVVARLDAGASATQTGLLLLANSSLKRVEIGAADSGGAGYRMLRVLN